MKKRILPAILATFSQLLGSTTIVWGPQLYFSERDSPFYGGIVDNTGEGIYLENFEDQALNTPFVAAPTNLGYFGSTIRQDNPNVGDGAVMGVDGDDGAVDGQTFAGDTWITINSSGFFAQGRMQFDFLPNSEGLYPTYVGIVVTEVSEVDLDVELSFLNLEGRDLFADGEYDPKEWSPPGGATRGSPLTMRFFGLYHSEGISRLMVENVRQVDHLQYGYSIPEPSSALLLIFGSLWSLKRKR
jgi:hypothetical protein